MSYAELGQWLAALFAAGYAIGGGPKFWRKR